MSITRWGAGDGQGCVPPAQKAATTYGGDQNAVCLCHFGRSDWSADFHFKAFPLAEATEHECPVTSAQRTDYSPSLHALNKRFSTLQLPPVHNASHPKLFPLEYFHLFKRRRNFLVCSQYMATPHPNSVWSSLSLSLLAALLCWELGAQHHHGGKNAHSEKSFLVEA